MGNREELLTAARTCLYQRGFAATTARDIADSAGVSLAAIGYHFGSKDQLISEAITEAIGDGIDAELENLIRTAGAGRSLAESFAATWAGIGAIFLRNREGIVASTENIVRVHRSSDGQRYTEKAGAQAVSEIAAILGKVYPELSRVQADAVGRLYYTLLNGLAIQWISNPDGALPTGDDFAVALAALAPQPPAPAGVPGAAGTEPA
ncbi:helix-turn-helix domain-containing protein [Nocardia sp. NPDC051463]|uniref:TetR/AcrR family transcriptional regulator n=1 Tax=Nocardia sp. NPDC051463 TaxID=3154845 RepID=UPI00344FA9C7